MYRQIRSAVNIHAHIVRSGFYSQLLSLIANLLYYFLFPLNFVRRWITDGWHLYWLNGSRTSSAGNLNDTTAIEESRPKVWGFPSQGNGLWISTWETVNANSKRSSFREYNTFLLRRDLYQTLRSLIPVYLICTCFVEVDRVRKLLLLIIVLDSKGQLVFLQSVVCVARYGTQFLSL